MDVAAVAEATIFSGSLFFCAAAVAVAVLVLSVATTDAASKQSKAIIVGAANWSPMLLLDENSVIIKRLAS